MARLLDSGQMNSPAAIDEAGRGWPRAALHQVGAGDATARSPLRPVLRAAQNHLARRMVTEDTVLTATIGMMLLLHARRVTYCSSCLL